MKKHYASFILLLLLIFLFEGCSDSEKTFTKLDDLQNASIGAMTGTTGESIARERFPQASIKSFDDIMDAVAALRSNQIDAVITAYPTAFNVCKHNPEIMMIPEVVEHEGSHIAVRKGNEKLLAELNDFIDEMDSNGTLLDMRNRWFRKDDLPYKTVEIKLPEKGEALKIGTSATREPFCFVDKENNVTGHEGEMAKRIAAKLGRPIQFFNMKFAALIPALQSGKIDMIVAGMTETAERKKSVDFSKSYFESAQVILVKNEDVKINTDDDKIVKLEKLDDVSDKTIGVYAGTIHDAFCEKKFPDADIKRFNAPADIILALKTKKINVAFMDLSSALVQLKSNPDIGILTDEALSLPVGYCFNKKNTGLRQNFNAFLRKAKADGTYDEVMTRWFKEDPEKAKMPKIEMNTTGKPLTLGVSVGDLPNVAIINGEYVGFDIEFLKRFARNEGYNLKIITMEFSSLIAALAAGKVDIIADGICITEERAKQVDFSEPYNHFKTAVIALKTNIAAFAGEESNVNKEEPSSFTSFFNGVAESFYNNIIVENRYLLIIDGLQITIIISILSTLFGTILGGIICFMRMSRRKILLLFAKFYISILRGTPVLVLLMIIFYVVFASVDIDPVVVSVIAFGLNFAAYVSEMFRTGIEGVDKGQTEAGIAIGFTKVKTFIYIVLPQAVRRILPVYKGEMISLVKMTSIVGYIAVQDLTKASDIIRSRTFDAFFPLIMVAVLYFIISWLLMLGLGYIERKANPKTSRG